MKYTLLQYTIVCILTCLCCNSLQAQAPASNYTELGYFAIATPLVPLPVTLINFDAARRDQSVLLSWQTTAEYNSKQFIIEHSGDGIHFRVLDSLPAAVNSSNNQQYRLWDRAPYTGKNFYKLTQYDKDGRSVSYPIRVVDMGNESITFLKINPNPVVSNIIDVTTVAGKAIDAITITDASGKTMYQIRKLTVNNIGRYSITLPQKLPTGFYFITISVDDISCTEKLLVK